MSFGLKRTAATAARVAWLGWGPLANSNTNLFWETRKQRRRFSFSVVSPTGLILLGTGSPGRPPQSTLTQFSAETEDWLKCCFTSTETVGLLGTGSPGRPLRLSHSSRALKRRRKREHVILKLRQNLDWTRPALIPQSL